MTITLNGTTGISSPGGDTASVSLTTPIINGGSTLSFQANGTTNATLSAAGNLGINTTSPGSKLVSFDGSAWAHINGGNTTSGGAIPWIATYNDQNPATATYGWGFYNSSATGNLDIWARNGTTAGFGVASFSRANGNFQITATNAGIQFSNSSALTNSVLNDYEVGTWTPQYFVNSSAGSGVTYSTQTGSYVKIGKFVMAQFSITINSVGSSSGSVQIGNMPFQASFAGGYGMSSCNCFAFTSNIPTVLQVPGTTYVDVKQLGTDTNIQTTSVQTGTQFRGTIYYETSF